MILQRLIMDKSRFLVGNQNLVDEWWSPFEESLQFAQKCTTSPNVTLNISSVNLVCGNSIASWNPCGIIEIDQTSLAEGALFHEVFHSALHDSPFKKKSESNSIKYGLYCECLCNTFQYLMEIKSNKRGAWAKRYDGWKTKNWAEIISQSTDLPYDMTYGLPTLEFIKACGEDLTKFQTLMAEMNSRS